MTTKRSRRPRPGSVRLGSLSAPAPKKIARALGDNLNGFEWDHIVTLTYKFPRTPERIQRDVEAGWIRRCERNAQRPVAWFYAIERGAAGLLHVHALIWGTARLTPKQLDRAWRSDWQSRGRKLGRTQIDRYDPSAGGAWYASKDVCERALWWDVSLRKPPERKSHDNSLVPQRA
jgi:hypothetical protein